MRYLRTFGLVVLLANLSLPSASADDWPQFRGPGGRGVSSTKAPTEWSDSKNLKWAIPLPGPGCSSPVVSGRRIFVTCYSGYGLNADKPGNPRLLRRHLLCVDRTTGKIKWVKNVPALILEDPYKGFITDHGYSSSTPVTDGKRVYTFFGKMGVMAFDMKGKLLWRSSVGTESEATRWGSGASLILYKNLVIVNASYESQSLRALDKFTGVSS